ncbi:triphosphoribosyl-dephospho-CoA synthase [Vibrio nitrifigilis]|uniref:Probable 2-(5''-triphosphoribosyl)-3'-dephosphocoenzyme-A synthase n=1 Tax=Vibrio nitrifigilis TaxID=2789781 RepID=A0ABS0GF54_9VIBR|nr:triphosphoribosyl-dephospho-CoA synthase [Vibrio nitrifigilis]MBF9001002.1 triphosphoribosyl-dephospho-CoA synthase [Vibrio nitrifigilis]
MQSSQRSIPLNPVCDLIGELAKQALIAEVTLTPKPGLVDAGNTGSHTDLTLDLMVRSAMCLAPYFSQMAQAANQQPVSVWLREKIGALGREAEVAMMTETGGINTHRGAIWALGLLSTSAQVSSSHPLTAEGLCEIAGDIARLEDRHVPNTFSKGKCAINHYQVNGAKQQAQLGFPAITDHALPTLRLSRLLGHSETEARLNALLALTAHLTDTCVLSRAGLEGQQLLQSRSNDILALGGVSTDKGFAMLEQLDQEMMALNASPGGAADLLAATLFVDWVEHSELSK